MAELSREEFLAHIEPLRADVAEVKQHLGRQNGRLADAERNIGILQDRSDDLKVSRWIDRGIGAAVAAFLGVKEFWFR